MDGAGEPVKTISVLVAEDEELIRRAFCLLVQSLKGVEFVGEAENGAVAVNMVCERTPDIVLMDLAMPVMSGIEAAARIRELSPGTRVIALTGLRDPEEIVRGLTGGMDGFLLKSASPDELKLALVTVAGGECYMSPQVASIVALEHVVDRRRGNLSPLSLRETEIVELLACGNRAKQIACKLGISDKTVDKHCENARRKLKAATTAEMVGACQRLTWKGNKSG